MVLAIGLTSSCKDAAAEKESAMKTNAKRVAEIMECVPSKRWDVCVCFVSFHRYPDRGQNFSIAVDSSGKACQ